MSVLEWISTVLVLLAAAIIVVTIVNWLGALMRYWREGRL